MRVLVVRLCALRVSQRGGPLEDTGCVAAAGEVGTARTHPLPVSQRVTREGGGVGFCVFVGVVTSGALAFPFEQGAWGCTRGLCTLGIAGVSTIRLGFCGAWGWHSSRRVESVSVAGRPSCIGDLQSLRLARSECR